MKFTTWLKRIFTPVKRCSVCGRRLTTKQDRARGMGPGCARRIMKTQLGNNGSPIPAAVNEDGREER